MKRIKLIIDIDEPVYEALKSRAERKEPVCCTENAYLIQKIIDGTPYNPTGDCISRKALKEQINATDFDFGDYYDNTEEIRKRVCETIDNAPTVENKQDDMNFCPNCGADMRGGVDNEKTDK